MKTKSILKSGEVLLEISVADSYFLRLRGLIGRDVNQLGGLLIKPCNQIHTCFMSTNMDAVYLDKRGKVLKIEPDIAPGKFCKAVKGGKAVLELPPGRAKSLGINENDILEAC